LNSFNGIAE